MEKKGEINFKPLSDGLGFHPFSDGLPYAPVNPAKNGPGITRSAPLPSLGTGATSAGRPRYSPPPAKIQVPVATKTQATPPEAPAALASRESLFSAGYLVRRTTAYLVDTALNLGVGFGALGVVLSQQQLSLKSALTPGIAFLTLLLAWVANWALITAQEVGLGTTVGKRLLGLRIEGDPAAVFLRAFFFVPSFAFCGLGLVWSLIDRRKRCWHDVVVDLQPTYLR
jgi:hypothetical protein